MEAQPGGNVTLRWSDDGGFTWTGGPRVLRVGPDAGLPRRRIFTTRLGSFRQRMSSDHHGVALDLLRRGRGYRAPGQEA